MLRRRSCSRAFGGGFDERRYLDSDRLLMKGQEVMEVAVKQSAARERTVCQYLKDDHKKLDRLLGQILAMVSDNEIERADLHARDLLSGLEHHIRVEEEVLFPIFEARTLLCAPCEVMRLEHQRIRRLLSELDDALAKGKGDLATKLLTDLSQLLEAHNQKEEAVLYPRADAELSEDERRAVVKMLEER